MNPKAEEGDTQTMLRGLSVQSSYKLKLPPDLIVPSSNIKLIETIGQGECVTWRFDDLITLTSLLLELDRST